MNKTALIEAIATEAGISRTDAKKALNAFIHSTSVALKNGQKVSLPGFGTFSVTTRAARTGRNPRTGAEITIPAKRVPKFKAGTELKNFLR
jgi:DNA-binding protein HU-beta